jgi:predicted enzyme related to lactoylglutathione lyase
MASTFHSLAYDTFDARAAATFWGAVLHLRVAPGASADSAELLDVTSVGAPNLVFRKVTDGRVLHTPLHLRLTTTDLDAESRRLERLGARRLGRIAGPGARSVTFTDPEGNAFDLVAA